MRIGCIVLVGALSVLVPRAGVASSERVYVERGKTGLPTVMVFLGDPPLGIELIGRKYQLEWTANGQPMSPNLTGLADCVYGSAQAYGCDALKQWFWDPRGTATEYR